MEPFKYFAYICYNTEWGKKEQKKLKHYRMPATLCSEHGWERITKTNHEDVIYYKALLLEYTRDLLLVMREDFLEEITSHHIKNKVFEDD